MSILLQISDMHFGTEQAPVVEALATLARQQKPDVLVLSGDISSAHGRRSSGRRAHLRIALVRR